ncbi:SMI1/KNR4 family protein [Williamwhitmania taraxaci]|uniref:SMI1 / KNR4 family (SUKH-1) n=1 Tax=Williamwhitmania taraxaci TaxID=1640674 RepID=A0A1G6TV49_9BACT|nr:SMI1/KNR4 family protein [Williamwhitmania taraxaci]SDD32257.1 SMI1 / KNR4 family (SUKH-1) [Williamwhitmania taraxaci]
MEELEEILLRLDFKKRNEKPKKTIEEIETLIKFQLPLDYKKFLENYMCFEGSVGKEYIQLWSLEELIETNINYGILDNLTKTIGIGGNGSNEFIAIELTEEHVYRIVLSPFIDLDKQYHIEIGTSFTDFLTRLETGKEWFENETE